jgi:hypothetical protein
LFATESPPLLDLGWGIIATWWVGLLLSVGGGVIVVRVWQCRGRHVVLDAGESPL